MKARSGRLPTGAGHGGHYGFHRGYWGRHVGYYGGVNYGGGYGGIGFSGGEWRGREFRYNTAVTRVDQNRIHSTYSDRTIVERNTIANNNRVAYSGGPTAFSTPPAPRSGWPIATSTRCRPASRPNTRRRPGPTRPRLPRPTGDTRRTW
jgi:hypothetical protein